jgi:hypothetical protein
MRVTWIAVAALSLAAAGSTLANAQTNRSATKYHYETCSCHFGYGNVCMVAVSCNTGGGRCAGRCTLPPNERPTNR